MKHSRRVLRRQGFTRDLPVRLVVSWEIAPNRGLLHPHVVLPYGTHAERVFASEYRQALSRLSGRYGFGWVDRKVKVYGARATAGYVSKYLTKTQYEQVLRAVNRPVMVATRLTMATGVTMRSLRAARWYWTCLRYEIPFPASWKRDYEYLALLDRLAFPEASPRGP